MTSSEVKAKPGSDVTPLGEETSDFDDDTLKGEDSRYSLIRSRWTGKLFSYKLFPALLLLFFFYCSCNVLSLSVFFLFISNTCSFNVHANIETSSSQSMG